MTETTNISIIITGTLVLYLIHFSIWVPKLDFDIMCIRIIILNIPSNDSKGHKIRNVHS